MPFEASFFSFWSIGPSFPFILVFWVFILSSLPFLGTPFGPAYGKFWNRNAKFKGKLLFWARSWLDAFGPSFLSFWPFGASFSVNLFLGLHFFHVGFLGFILSMWLFRLLFSPFAPFVHASHWQIRMSTPLLLLDGSPDLWTWQRLRRHIRDGQPRPNMLNDAAGVSHAPAPVLHREGFLAGPLPTDDVVQASTWQTNTSHCWDIVRLYKVGMFFTAHAFEQLIHRHTYGLVP